MEWRFENVVHWTQETAAVDARIEMRKRIHDLMWCAVLLFIMGALLSLFFPNQWVFKFILLLAIVMAGRARGYSTSVPRQAALQCKRWMVTGGMPVVQTRVSAEAIQKMWMQTGCCFTVPLQDVRQVWTTEKYLILQLPEQIRVVVQKDAFLLGDLEGFVRLLREKCPSAKWKYLKRKY